MPDLQIQSSPNFKLLLTLNVEYVLINKITILASSNRQANGSDMMSIILISVLKPSSYYFCEWLLYNIIDHYNADFWITCCAWSPSDHGRVADTRKMADVSTIFTGLLILVIFVLILARSAIKITVSSSWYKRKSAQRQNRYAKLTSVIFQPVRRKLFADLGDHLKAMHGDVLEIGIGSGQSFDDYPQGTSLIAVDSNPYVEKLLRENLEKSGNRVHLKKFVVASAEDMSYMGKVGVEDNSVAAVVCMKLLCSLTDDQITKTVQEVKRVLMPVSISCLFYRPVTSLKSCDVLTKRTPTPTLAASQPPGSTIPRRFRL